MSSPSLLSVIDFYDSQFSLSEHTTSLNIDKVTDKTIQILIRSLKLYGSCSFVKKLVLDGSKVTMRGVRVALNELDELVELSVHHCDQVIFSELDLREIYTTYLDVPVGAGSALAKPNFQGSLDLWGVRPPPTKRTLLRLGIYGVNFLNLVLADEESLMHFPFARTRSSVIRLGIALSAVFLSLLPSLGHTRSSRIVARQIILNPKSNNHTLSIDGITIDSIVAFGDSLTDIGSFFLESDGIPSSPYFNGRYSNGPLYIEYMANKTGATLVNFAFAGATTGSSGNKTVMNLPAANAITVDTLSLSGQVELYLSEPNTIENKGTVHLINIGMFDYIDYLTAIASGGAGASNTEAITTSVVSNITAAITRLNTQGANTFVIVGLSDLSILPIVNNVQKLSSAVGTLFTSSLAEITSKHNSKLQAALTTFAASSGSSSSGLRVRFINMASDATVTAARAKFSAVTECLSSSKVGLDLAGPYTACTDPAAHWFWDYLHPTTQAHSAIADVIISQLQTVASSVAGSPPSPSAASPSSVSSPTAASPSAKSGGAMRSRGWAEVIAGLTIGGVATSLFL
ncbi:hypothetical protein HDU93_008247 [Gonapodya sp. JEL0774]|nr:hypothetical protein HDU93_008247 [Gonapodya sp. JEL0774]